VFQQSTQLHPEQNFSAAKHSQYSLRHFDFLQLQGLFLEPFGGTDDEMMHSGLRSRLAGLGNGTQGVGILGCLYMV
jgi:hypothetical protein